MKLFSAAGNTVTITDGGNNAAVLAALADAADETENPLFVAAGLQGFNGATLDMIRALGDDSDAVAAASLGRLLALCRLSAFNGTTFDRLRSEGNDRDAIAVATLGKLENINYPHLFNATTWDRQRALGTASLDGLGQASVSPAIPGATAVQSIHHLFTGVQTTRVTVITPASGLRIRVLNVSVVEPGGNLTTRHEVYFGTGANISTTPANAVFLGETEVNTRHESRDSYPDGGGPVGAADAVLSLRLARDIGDNTEFVIHWREE